MRRESLHISRRAFLDAAGATLAAPAQAAPERSALMSGAPLQVKPVFLWTLPNRREYASWRPYGGLATRAEVDQEARRIADEVRKLAACAEFPVEAQPVAAVNSAAEAASAADAGADVFLVYAYNGPRQWLETIEHSRKPNIMFLRHKSGPFYCWYENAHYRFLRVNEDTPQQPYMDFDDVVVDDYAELLWRLRALYGLKNARGTRSLAIGGLRSYSVPGQLYGPAHVRVVWGYTLVPVSEEEVAARVAKARQDPALAAEAERRTAALLAEPGVTLSTERKFVVNTFLALAVFKELMQEHNCSNVGVANCMGSIIRVLDTPPCLLFSLLNDEGYTAYCHTDYTHTPPGVLLRWISGKPSFIANTHYPHAGMVTLAHCATPRRMNGRDCEPTRIMTHYESDYGAATRVEFTKRQVVTTLIPNLTCTKWTGFRGVIENVPNYPACRSQIDMKIDGDWRALLHGMPGFHAVLCYGDYLREVGYALKKTGIQWRNFSAD